MSGADVEAKVHNLTWPVLGTERVARLAEMIWRLDRVESVRGPVRASIV
jgi:hypothetical protein